MNAFAVILIYQYKYIQLQVLFFFFLFFLNYNLVIIKYYYIIKYYFLTKSLHNNYIILEEPLFPKIFSVIGFLTESDAPLPAYRSRYLLLPYEKQVNKNFFKYYNIFFKPFIKIYSY